MYQLRKISICEKATEVFLPTDHSMHVIPMGGKSFNISFSS